MPSLRDSLSLSYRRLAKKTNKKNKTDRTYKESYEDDHYRELYDKIQVRLMEFDPDVSGPFHFKSHTFCLSKTPKFDALSFGWGTSEDGEKVMCDGELTDIPTSLSVHLYSLYRFQPIRFLWIDALCINQRTLEGIEDMPMIHRKATRTICFPGFKDFDSLKILADITQRVGKYPIEVAGTILSTDIYHSTYKIDHKLLNAFEAIASTIDETTRRDLDKFFDQTYFHRLWTMQDLVCSKNPLIFDGRNAIPMSQLAEGLLACLLFSTQVMVQSSGALFLLLTDAMHRRYHGLQGTHITLLDTLLSISACEVTTAYALDITRVAYSIGKHIYLEGPLLADKDDYHSGDIRAALDLNTLSHQPLSLSLVDEATSDLPSWTPSWETRSKRFLLNHAASNFAASSHKTTAIVPLRPEPTNSTGTLILRCDGVTVDAIQSTAGYIPPRRHCDHYAVNGGNSFFYTEWFDFANDVLRGTRADDRIMLEYADTIQARGCGHIWEHPITDPQERLREVRQFLDFLENPDAEETNAVRLFHAACYPSHDRRLGVTQNKRLCLVPSATRSGDLICIPHGSRVPYIFRKRKDDVGYQNIGEAYVHGAMNSELSGVKDLEEQEFVLY